MKTGAVFWTEKKSDRNELKTKQWFFQKGGRISY